MSRRTTRRQRAAGTSRTAGDRAPGAGSASPSTSTNSPAGTSSSVLTGEFAAAVVASVARATADPVASRPPLPSNLTRGDAIARMEELYARLPQVACKGLCHHTCTVIPATELERQRVEEAGGSLGPRLSPQQIAQIRQLPLADVPDCPAKGPANNCTVYAARPSVCRGYGVVEGLRCPFGCTPDNEVMPNEEFRMLRVELEQLSRHVTGVRSSCA